MTVNSSSGAVLAATPVRTRAQGKLILVGEHVILYGAPALATQISLGVDFEVRPAGEPGVTWNLEACVRSLEEGTALGHVLAFISDTARDHGVGLHLTVTSELPPGMGLGWSAAFSYGAALALKTAIPSLDAFAFATEAETQFHGKASGLDLATVASGGCLRAWRPLLTGRPGGGTGDLQTEPFAKSIPGVAVVAGTYASPTREMVAGVARLVAQEPAFCQKLIDRQAAIERELEAAIDRDDGPACGALLNEAHRNLQRLRVSSPWLDELVDAALAAGAWGAKLTGGGGGGCMFALAAPDKAAAVRAALATLTPHLWTMTLGTIGAAR